MNKFFRLLIPLLFIALTICLVMPLVASAEMVKKVDNFIVFMDQSGSMAPSGARTGSEKFDKAVSDVKRFEGNVPDLGYNGGLALFAPYKLLKSPSPYEVGSYGPKLDKVILPFTELTTLGVGLSKLDSVLSGSNGKTAVILFTDGAHNDGVNPVSVASKLYSKYDPNLCFHVVSYADDPTSEKIISEISSLSSCSVVVDGKSLETDEAMTQFAKSVLYEEVVASAPPPKPAPKPAPKPVPVKVAKEVITFNLLFDFDKAQIKDEMIPTLEQAQMILEEDPETDFVLSGHTDSIGTQEYNQGLSERRAAAVKKWLVDNGVPGNRLKTVGYGETRAKYDNSTREGRKLNRRVEMQSQ